MKMHKKSGVTVVALSIAVAVLAILTAAAIINIDNIIPTARKAKIAEEFSLIEEKVKEYYLAYGNYPVLNDTAYTKSEVVDLNTTGKSDSLEAEITKNGDDNSIFFLVDLRKLRLTTFKYGNNVTVDDVYVVADLTGTVYYPKGVTLNSQLKFSSKAFEDTAKIDE